MNTPEAIQKGIMGFCDSRLLSEEPYQCNMIITCMGSSMEEFRFIYTKYNSESFRVASIHVRLSSIWTQSTGFNLLIGQKDYTTVGSIEKLCRIWIHQVQRCGVAAVWNACSELWVCTENRQKPTVRQVCVVGLVHERLPNSGETIAFQFVRKLAASLLVRRCLPSACVAR